tara:strand:+ start:224 stop:856 length:633 start_codon:yes stop_codon:yes gene_type:complete
MHSRRIVAVLLLALVAGAAAAQDRNLPYVDIAAANTEIQNLQSRNQEMTAQNDQLSSENDQLLGQIRQDQQSLVEIDPILARVDAQLSDLFAVNRTIVDEQMKSRSQEAIGRARTIKSNLQEQMRTLTEQIRGNREQIDGNRERIRINERRIAENEERVLFLQAAIQQTQAQQQRLDSFITNVDSILSDAEQYVDVQQPANSGGSGGGGN